MDKSTTKYIANMEIQGNENHTHTCIERSINIIDIKLSSNISVPVYYIRTMYIVTMLIP